MASSKQAQTGKVPSYRGRQAKTGNSLGLRFDKALFQSHPEFLGDVRAHVIAPGRMLVVADPAKKARRRDSDPVVEAFLSFLAEDMVRFPEQIKPLDEALFTRIDTLVGHLPFNPHEDLGDEPLF
jgi:hypothetical protein